MTNQAGKIVKSLFFGNGIEKNLWLRHFSLDMILFSKRRT